MELRIPNEYQEIEYIGTSIGTNNHPYINTNIIPNINMRVHITGITKTNISSANFLFGSRISIGSEPFWGIIWKDYYKYGYGNKNNTDITKAQTEEIFDFNFNHDSNHSMTANGVTVTGAVVSDTQTYSNPMYLFGINTNGKIDNNQQMSVNISSFKVYESYTDANPIMNLIPCYRKSDSEIGMYDTVSKTFYTNSGTGTFLKGADVIRYNDNVSVVDSRRRILIDAPHIETVSGDIANFNTDLASGLQSCKINFEPIQEGSGDPSPTNIRLINGWTNIDLTRCGKNIKEWKITDTTIPESYTGNFNGFDNNLWDNALNNIPKAWLNKDLVYSVYLKKSEESTPSYIDARMWEYNKDNKITFSEAKVAQRLYVTSEIKRSWIYHSLLDSTVKVGYGLYVSKYDRAYNPMVELGTEPTEYEPYNGITLSVDWADEIGTVYGGYVDLVKGELIKTHDIVDLGTLEWKIFNSASVSDIFYTTDIQTSDKPSLICTNYPFKKSYMAMEDKTCSWIYTYRIAIKDSDYSTVEEFKEGMSGVYVCYPLATPVSYQLTPQTINALKGINNIYSNTNGTTEVKYWTH